VRLFDEHALGVLQLLKLAPKLVEPPARRVEPQSIADKLGHCSLLSRDSRPQRIHFGLELWQQLVRHDEIRQLQSAITSTAIRAAAGTTIGGTNQSATAKAFAMFAPNVKEARFDPGFLD
jgi:hypothetical protein